MAIGDPALGITLVVLGALLAIAGIVIAVIIPTLFKKLEAFLKPLVELLGGLQNPLLPLILPVVNTALARVYKLGRLVGLVGGAGLFVVGAIVVILGVQIWY